MNNRETLGSRLGFILLSAGCAIGLGNVWRFPYITGKNGGAGFVLIYLFFLVLLGLPVMTVEFSLGRASRQNIGLSLRTLEKPGSKWHLYGPAAVAGNYLLLMFYTTIAGWILYYFFSAASGAFQGVTTEGIGKFFSDLTADPVSQVFWMIIIMILCASTVAVGLQKGVEKITKVMMAALLSIMLILTVHSFTLPGAGKGLKFYLLPDFSAMKEIGIGTVMYEALGQAFFTLSVGIGSMSIFGSYIDDSRSLAGESARIIALDTFVAITSGLIIFPACFSYDVSVGQGPSLLFITLPNIFSQMTGGRIWSSLFFLFMSFAAFSTVIAVFENIISYYIDVKGWTRRKACLVNFIALTLLSLPCILGFNVLSGFQPLGEGSNILDLEDFMVSNILLPFGSLLFVLFATRKSGWGFENFLKEANKGKGMKFSAHLRYYLSLIIPIIILIIMIKGIWDKFI
ncbi:MAG: sodium-dependent transporter [Bullifex sp.]